MEHKNTVSSVNQVHQNVYFEGADSGSPKIMFVGNSITHHKPAPHIGWYGNWGMAASAKEKDYVHLCMHHVQKQFPNASFCIVQAADWERGYKDIDLQTVFKDALQFQPDIIITRLSENIPSDYLERDAFIGAMKIFHQVLSGGKQVKHVVTSNVFDNKEKDGVLEDYAKEAGAFYVYLDDYKQNKENFASSFEHGGVSIHPGDRGMKMIAERIIVALDEILNEDFREK